MLTTQRLGARAAAALVAAALSSCGADEHGTVSFAGTWQGAVAGSPEYLPLTQQGRDVAGTLSGMALAGRVDGISLSFSLTGQAGLYCSVNANGSATMARMADRDRLSLSYYGADSCNGTFSRSGSLDRLRCPGGMLACSGGVAERWVPYCAQGQTDASNCGQCGLKCGEYQACIGGACQVPACTSPVRLQAPRQYLAAALTSSLVLGDVNGDGFLDAVVSSVDTWYMGPVLAAVSVLLGDGHGGFGTPIPTELSFPPAAIAIGDVDGDGRLDAVVYGGPWDGPATVAVLLGNGDGSFRPGPTFPAGVDRMIGGFVALADLDREGTLDLVIPGPTPSLQVRLGLGDGTFGPSRAYALPAAPEALLASDLDGDGIADLAAASSPYPESRVSVLLGSGDGTFRPAVDHEGVKNPHDIAIGDFDENGVPDLVVAGGDYNWEVILHPAVAVLLGAGDGTFAPPVGIVERQTDEAFGLAVADLDGDGHQDVAVAEQGEFEVVLGNGDGTFAPGVRFPVPGGEYGSGARSVAAGDLDGQGTADLVVLNFEKSVTVFLACGP